MSVVMRARWLIPRQCGSSDVMTPGYGCPRRSGRGNPTSKITVRSMVGEVRPPYGEPVLDRLLQPWRSAQTWRSLVHTVLDLPLGIVSFTPTVALLFTTLGLAVALPVALIPLSLLLVW